jgi:hypothetical protein
MKSYNEEKWVLWMPQAMKIRGGKFRLPWKGPFKAKKERDNNTIELSTINNGTNKLNNNTVELSIISNDTNKLDDNIVELSTISNDDVEIVNINKLKRYRHNHTPTDDAIVAIMVDTKPINKPRRRHGKRVDQISSWVKIQTKEFTVD